MFPWWSNDSVYSCPTHGRQFLEYVDDWQRDMAGGVVCRAPEGCEFKTFASTLASETFPDS
jgi:hypothetical protein